MSRMPVALTLAGSLLLAANALAAPHALTAPQNHVEDVRVVQRVPVKIRFTDNRPRGRLVPGLSARVEIEPGRGS